MTAIRQLMVIATTTILLPAAGLADAPSPAGSIEAVVDGERIVLTAVTSHYDIKVNGDLASVRVTQRFTNPLDKPLHATYLFPLTKDAAVHHMLMRVGDEQIRTQIEETSSDYDLL